MDTEGESTSTDPAPRPRRRGPGRLGIISLSVVVVTLVAIVIGIRTQLSIADTSSSLATSRQTLHRAHVRLEDTLDQLATTKIQSAAAASTLAGVSAQLKADQSALARAQMNVVANGVNISALDTCLSGVEQVLNQIAVGDDSGATSTLSSVEGTCKSVLPTSS